VHFYFKTSAVMKITLLFQLFIIISSSIIYAQNISRFRGDNGQGIYDASDVPAKWKEQDFDWKVALPGKGHSSPVIWGDKIFVTSADETSNHGRLLAVDLNSGKILWRHESSMATYKINSKNSFASVSPTVDANHVYVLWFSEEKSVLSALTHTGDKAWSSEFDGVYSRHGVGASPIVADELVIFTCEQEAVKKGPFVSRWFAVDRNTGQVRWQLERNMVKSNSQSTPTVLRQKGRSLLVFTSEAHGFSGVDLQSGQLVWEFNPFGSRAISSPVIANDLIIGSCKSRLFAINISEDNKGEVEYKLEHKYSPYVPTPIFKDGLLYSFTDTGNISCHDARTGELIWREKPAGGYYSSPIYADGRLYGVTRDGDVVVLSVGKKYELLAVNSLGESTHATPIAINCGIIFRTFSQLMCVRSD
jgi:outer membrane protein assembly factor BamB